MTGNLALRRPFLLTLMMLAAPFEARADQAFCAALAQLVSAAQSRFDWMPRSGRNIPGSIEERHGTLQTADGAPRGVYYAVMARGGSAAAHERFAALQREVGGCLPNAAFQGLREGAGSALVSWQTDYAVIGLRRADGGGDTPAALVELSIASRW